MQFMFVLPQYVFTARVVYACMQAWIQRGPGGLDPPLPPCSGKVCIFLPVFLLFDKRFRFLLSLGA